MISRVKNDASQIQVVPHDVGEVRLQLEQQNELLNQLADAVQILGAAIAPVLINNGAEPVASSEPSLAGSAVQAKRSFSTEIGNMIGMGNDRIETVISRINELSRMVDI